MKWGSKLIRESGVFFVMWETGHAKKTDNCLENASETRSFASPKAAKFVLLKLTKIATNFQQGCREPGGGGGGTVCSNGFYVDI